MTLLTDALRAILLANGSANAGREDTIDFKPVVKLFCPWGGTTWLLTEVDPEDPDIAFGLATSAWAAPNSAMSASPRSKTFAGRAEIADVPFSVTTQIERAPHWTMIRELPMNAIEAASHAKGEKIVHWTSRANDGVRKAVIWNTGPGMSAVELKRATNRACRIDKTLGIDENFGVGAKVSSLANNKLGMRFRSCKNGKVSEVVLGYDPDLRQYVRFERRLSNGKRDTVIDVTVLAEKDGHSLGQDWTEVTLFGNSEEQDTAARPLASTPTDKGYIATALYRLPEDVKVRLDETYHRLGNTRPLTPLGQRFDRYAKHETVGVPELKIKVHFLHDPTIADKSGLRSSSRGALASSTTTCALVHRNEVYSVMTGNEWSAAAPHFGIPFGSKELCVHIELEDDEARASQYRERLITKDTAVDIVPQDYAFCVREVMPEWVKEVIRKATVFALAKRASEDWDEQAFKTALAKESLTLAADNYLESLAAIRREVKEGIKVAGLAAA